MKARVYDTNGSEIEQIDLPAVFETPLRPDIIKRAVLSSRANRRQPFGPDRWAGFRTSAENWGVGRGKARVPRIKGSRHPAGARAAVAPMAIKGHPAHAPKPERVWTEKVNKKEKHLAIRSAIAATADAMLVEARGHIVEPLIDLPLVVSNDFEQLKTTKEAIAAFAKLGLIKDPSKSDEAVRFGDIDKANERMKKVRAGKGKRRGRKHKNATSALIVYGSEPNATSLFQAARNLPGVKVVHVSQLNAELLAPGTHPGRLTVWVRSAIDALASNELFV